MTIAHRRLFQRFFNEPGPDIELAELVPAPGLFHHVSTLHGQAHVSRVLVHAIRLIEATGWKEEAPRLWAAVYLHDIARTHDGYCEVHGRRAMDRVPTLHSVLELFAKGGVSSSDFEQIETAVVHHCKAPELPRSHPHWRLTSLLKDADGLDRVRLGDLNPRYLRHPESKTMVAFAERLFSETDGVVPTGEDHFARLWQEVTRIEATHLSA
jgi:hypothetical protein